MLRRVCAAESGSNPKPNPRALVSNWTSYDAPFTTKLRMAFSNNLLKIRKHQNCCGNYGQPGC
jgi:hypothetical protein